MITNKLAKTIAVNSNLSFIRFYTCIVERIFKPPTVKKEYDQRTTKLKSKHYQYRFIDCLHVKPWGNVDLILTQFVEGKKTC